MIQILFRTDKAILLKVRMEKEEDKGILQQAKFMGDKACHKNLRSTQRKLTGKKNSNTQKSCPQRFIAIQLCIEVYEN